MIGMNSLQIPKPCKMRLRPPLQVPPRGVTVTMWYSTARRRRSFGATENATCEPSLGFTFITKSHHQIVSATCFTNSKPEVGEGQSSTAFARLRCAFLRLAQFDLSAGLDRVLRVVAVVERLAGDDPIYFYNHSELAKGDRCTRLTCKYILKGELNVRGV